MTPIKFAKDAFQLGRDSGRQPQMLFVRFAVILCLVSLINLLPTWALLDLPVVNKATTQKILELCVKAEGHMDAFDTRRLALSEFQQALSMDPSSVLIFEIHSKIRESLHLIPTTHAVMEKYKADKAIQDKFGPLRGPHRLMLTEILMEIDNTISVSSASRNELLALTLTKGYIYVDDLHGRTPEDIARAVEIFEKIIASKDPAWVLNGLIGLVEAKGLAGVYLPAHSISLERIKICREIIRRFPKTVYAALAQGQIISAFGFENKYEKETEAANELLHYEDFTIYRFRRGWIESNYGKTSLHAEARLRLRNIQLAIERQREFEASDDPHIKAFRGIPKSK